MYTILFMFSQSTHKITFIRKFAAFAFCGALLTSIVHAETMSSTNYHIQSDSLNFGGNRSTSASYISEDTAGEIATGPSSSSNFSLKAGYQQMQEIYLSVTAVADVAMSPAIGGVTGGTSNGSTAFTVTTDNQAGYTVAIKASSSPALVSSLGSFADYAPAGGVPEFTFVNDPTESSFAFSPEGVDIDQRYKDFGGVCNTGSGDTSLSCWDGLSTSDRTIVSRTSANHPNGTATTIRFRAASGSNHIQVEGEYTATSTITILPL
jgi:hypothetical protein